MPSNYEVITLNLAGTTPPYSRFLLRTEFVGQSYNTITSRSSALYYFNKGLLQTTGTDTWDWSTYTDIAIDLREYLLLMPGLTGALLYFTGCSYSQGSGKTWFPTTLNISGQRETTRSTALALSNYGEIYNGAFGGTAYSSDMNLTDFSGNIIFTLNTAGLDYLKSVGTKTYNPGYAFLSLLFGNQITNTPPSTPLSAAAEQYSFTGAYLFMYYDDAFPAVGINYGPSGFQTILGGKINVSNSWKTISEIKINVGDSWEDIT